jgi:hypothetical protein
VPDRVAELEARIAELAEALRRVEERLAAVERAPARAPAARRAAAAPAGGHATAGAPPRVDVPSATSLVTFAGRTLLVLAGGFVLRALTDAGTLAPAVGVGLGLAYAGSWIALADRAGRAGAKWSAGFHGGAAAVLGFPLLFEGTFRLRLLSPGQATILLAGLTAVALGVAARRRLQGLAWLVALGGAVTAASLALAPVGGRALLPTVYVVLLGCAALWLGYVLDWHGPRWPVALVADGLVLLLAARAAAPGATEGPAAAFLGQGVLLLAFLGSFVARTLWLGRPVVPFEIVQTVAALAAGLGGAAWVAGTAGAGGALGFGAAASVAGLAAYGVAFTFLERQARAAVNFAFYATVALALVLAGSALLLPGDALALAWALAGVVAAALAWRHGRRTLAIHGAVYAVAAALVSGLLSHAFDASFAAPAEAWPPASLAAVGALVAGAVTAWLAARAAPRDRLPLRLPQLVLVATVACGASGVLVGWLVPPLAGAPPGASAGTVATIRTAVWVGGALALAWLGRRAAWVEAGWLVVPALAAAGIKILMEDLPRSRPATLFLAFALYGGALILVARGRHRGREAGPDAKRPAAGGAPLDAARREGHDAAAG